MANFRLFIICYIYTMLLTLKYSTADKTIEFPESINNILRPSSPDLLSNKQQPKFELPIKSVTDLSDYKKSLNVLVKRQLQQPQNKKQQQQKQKHIITNNQRHLRSPTVIFSSDFDDILDLSADVLTQISTIINGRPLTTNTRVARPILHLVPPRPGRNIKFRPDYQSSNQKPNYYQRTMLTLPHVQRVHEFRPKRFMYPTQRPSITVNYPLSSSGFFPSNVRPSVQRPLSTNIYQPLHSAPISSTITASATINQQRPLTTNIFSPIYDNGNRRGRPLTANIFPK